MKLLSSVFLCFCFTLMEAYGIGVKPTTIVDLTKTEYFTVESLSLKSATHFSFHAPTKLTLVAESTQLISDIRLSISGCSAKTISDIPASYRQSEVIVFTIEPRSECILKVEGKTIVDTKSHTQLTIKRITATAEVKVYKLLSEAGSSWANSQTESNSVDSLKLAQKQYRNALQIAEANELQDLAWYSHYQMSIVAHYLGLYSQQANVLVELLERLPKNSPWRTPTLLDLATFYLYEKNDLEGSREFVSQAIALSNKLDQSLYNADALELDASIWAKSRLYSHAIEIFHRSYEIFIAEGAMQNALNTSLSLGYFYLRNGEFLNASTQYNAALILATQLQDGYSITNANIKLSTVYRNMGQLDLADNFVSTALSMSENYAHSFLDAWAHLEKGRLLAATQQRAFVIDHFESAKKAFQRLSAHHEAKNIDHVLADLHLRSGELDIAETNLKSYLDFATVNLQEHDVMKAKMTLARVMLAKRDPKKALALQHEAFEVLYASDDAFSTAHLILNMAISKAMLGQKFAAEEHFHDAIQRFQSLKADVNYVAGLYDYASVIGESQPEEAERILRLATVEMLRIHQGIKRIDLRRGFLAQFQSLISRRISIDNTLSPAESLLLAELVRADGLKATLSRTAKFKSIDETVSNELMEIDSRLSRQFVAMQKTSDVNQRSQIMKQLRRLSEQRYETEKKLYVNSYDLMTTNNLRFEQAELENLQQYLDENTLVIFYDTDEYKSHVWKVSREHITHRSFASEMTLGSIASSLLNQIKQKKQLQEMDKELVILSKQVLGPIGLPEKITNLIVIADGPLANFPLALLKNPNSNQFLFDSMRISQHHSLSLVLNQFKTQQTAKKLETALVIANPLMANEVTPLGFVAQNLPYSEVEANSLSKLLPDRTTVLTGVDATKQQLKSQSFLNYDIVHFATHALANSDLPELGGLILSNSVEEDNLLLAPDIKRLGMQVDLVVLSGCETTQGNLVAGEGILGLSRAFFESGAQNVIGSLWKVQDDATAMLMKHFYTYLLTEGYSITEALNKAQKEVRNYRRKDGRMPWRSPFYWAGFAMHGVEA